MPSLARERAAWLQQSTLRHTHLHLSYVDSPISFPPSPIALLPNIGTRASRVSVPRNYCDSRSPSSKPPFRIFFPFSLGLFHPRGFARPHENAPLAVRHRELPQSSGSRSRRLRTMQPPPMLEPSATQLSQLSSVAGQCAVQPIGPLIICD